MEIRAVEVVSAGGEGTEGRPGESGGPRLPLWSSGNAWILELLLSDEIK